MFKELVSTDSQGCILQKISMPSLRSKNLPETAMREMSSENLEKLMT